MPTRRTETGEPIVTLPDLSTAVAWEVLDGLSFRCIGPSRGGRVVAVAGDPDDPAVFYFGAAAGGVWKTDDAGRTWRNVSDDDFLTASIGALTVSDSDPNVVWAGTGESTIRGDVSNGDGVYRSTDGGRTWEHRGLDDTRHISEIVVHPRDPDRVLVAALGHAFGPNETRGVFLTEDGGATWSRVLHVSDRAGAADLTIDPRNPEVLYASLWEARRNFWELSSGGPDSGLWRSTDGGRTWDDITGSRGLPTGLLGKIGVSASPARAGRIWALVEAEDEPGLYRSDDHGDTWHLVSDRAELRGRPWYYMHVFADPVEEDTVYVNNFDLWRSTDGGRTFDRIGTPHGDNHDLWIDPVDNRRMIQSNDGGANVSFNRGASWSTTYNQLTAQLYTVTTDRREPFYRVYGTQQDNTSVSVPSSTNDDAITWSDCYPAGTGESGFMAVDPRDDDIVYVGAVGSSPGGGGALQRFDRRTGQIRLVNVWPDDHFGIGPGELRYRFPWTFPILFSPHDPGVLYTAGNVVFRSTDEGHSWEPISPDLTRDDPDKLGPSGGPITKDTSGAEHYCTIATLRESPTEPGVLWTGSDDGLVHISRDGGANWEDVTPADLPAWTFVGAIEPSPTEPGTVYLAATRYKLDDPSPYLFKTTNHGRTWTPITGTGRGALPDETITRVIRVDPEVPGLLYLGTEVGLHLSADDGRSWYRWDANLPTVPVYDLLVRGDDLVLATHGRSFWVLDDLGPLRRLGELVPSVPGHLFPPPAAWRILPSLIGGWAATEGRGYSVGTSKEVVFDATIGDDGRVERTVYGAGRSAPLGVTIHYHLDEAWVEAANRPGAGVGPDEPPPVSLTFLDVDGEAIRSFGPKPADWDRRNEDEQAFEPGPWLTVEPGLNRFVWDLRHPGAERFLGNRLAAEADRGPLVLPGRYRVRLALRATDGEEIVREHGFDVVNDPRVDVEPDDLAEQLELLLAIRDKLTEVNRAVTRIRSLADQVQGWRLRLEALDDPGDEALVGEATALASKVFDELVDIEDHLAKRGDHRGVFRLDEPVRLNQKLATLLPNVASADARPTTQARELVAIHSAAIDECLAALDAIVDGDLDQLNRLIAEASIPAIG
jgi:photosystem II stability/assembly factor-like uncharacterized protein